MEGDFEIIANHPLVWLTLAGWESERHTSKQGYEKTSSQVTSLQLPTYLHILVMATQKIPRKEHLPSATTKLSPPTKLFSCFCPNNSGNENAQDPLVYMICQLCPLLLSQLATPFTVVSGRGKQRWPHLHPHLSEGLRTDFSTTTTCGEHQLLKQNTDMHFPCHIFLPLNIEKLQNQFKETSIPYCFIKVWSVWGCGSMSNTGHCWHTMSCTEAIWWVEYAIKCVKPGTKCCLVSEFLKWRVWHICLLQKQKEFPKPK